MEISKKGFYFSLDAFVALSIVLAVLLFAVPFISYQSATNKVHYDTISSLSNLKVGEIGSAYVLGLINTGKITDLNLPVLEQIGRFYVTNITLAREFAAEMISNIPENKNIGIWFGDELLASRNVTPIEQARNVDVARQIITGIQKGKNITGYSSRAFLSSAKQTKYYFFGGYVGDGNITAPVNYKGNIESASVEVVVSNGTDISLSGTRNFSLYINGYFSGQYEKSLSYSIPVRYDIPNSALAHFMSGNNSIGFSGVNGEKIGIQGGFIRIVYNSSEIFEVENKKYFPGIKGIINVYDGFYVPGQLNSLNAYLHFNSNYTVNFTIGNTSIYGLNSSGENFVTLDNNYFSQRLNYAELANKTNPYQFIVQGNKTSSAGNADVVLITDLSKSMNGSLANESVIGVRRGCESAQLYNGTTARVSLAQCLDKQFIDKIFNVSGNRLAIVAIIGDPGSPNKGRVNRTDVFLSDASQIKSLIDNYNATMITSYSNVVTPVGGSCLCCALNSAYELLKTYSNLSRDQFVVAMSDGLPIYACGTGSSSQTGTDTGVGNSVGTVTSSCSSGQGAVSEADASQCTGTISSNQCANAILNANWSSCRVAGKIPGTSNQGTNATVYSVGFGPVDQCQWASNTLNYVAQCGNGAYYSSSNATQLQAIYQQIAESITSVSRTEQFSTGNIFTELYPDSYIQFDFAKQQLPYGLILNAEQKFSNTTSGSFVIPSNTQIIKASVVSYSGPKWTSVVAANKMPVYNLSKYGQNYSTFGDPYSISIPINFLVSSSDTSNNITLLTGNSSTGLFEGSSENKIIYTIIKNVSSYNSSISSSAQGCSWTIEFEDGTLSNFNIPASYTGTNLCSYSSSNIQHNSNDALQQSAFELLQILDFDSDHKIDVILTQDNLGLETFSVSGIPYTYQTEVQIRTWS